MKKQVVAFFLGICFCLLLASCMRDERSQAKKVVEDFLEAVQHDDETRASLLMPFLNTVNSEEKKALLSFFKGIASENYLLSVPDKKGSLYTVTLSLPGSEDSTIHYSFELIKESDKTWIIKDRVTQKITYEAFML